MSGPIWPEPMTATFWRVRPACVKLMDPRIGATRVATHGGAVKGVVRAARVARAGPGTPCTGGPPVIGRVAGDGPHSHSSYGDLLRIPARDSPAQVVATNQGGPSAPAFPRRARSLRRRR